MGFEEWVREYITKNTESQVTCSNSHDFASQSAQEQALGQLDNQTLATDTDKSYLLDSSQKRNKNAKNGHADENENAKNGHAGENENVKNGHADENVIEQRMKQQDEMRKHIDEEFIDINAYMLALVENQK